MPYRTKHHVEELELHLLVGKMLCTLLGCRYKIFLPADKIVRLKEKSHKIKLESFIALSKICCTRCNITTKTPDDSYYEFKKKLNPIEFEQILKIGIKEYERIFGRIAK